jgi:hypothetical protein
MSETEALAKIREFMRVAAKGNGPRNLIPGVLSILDAVEQPTGEVSWQFGARDEFGIVHGVGRLSHNEARDYAAETDTVFVRRRLLISDWEVAD